MLLTRLLRRTDDPRADRGNAMIAVIGLLAVTSMITPTVTGATVQALGYTSLPRASVQSNAAAEAGVDAMLAALAAGLCTGTGEVTATQGAIDPTLSGPAADAPFSVATLAYRANTASAWTEGCPIDAATQIRSQSRGFAADEGVADSASAGDSSAAQAIYEWTPGANAAAVTGAAVFSYGVPGLSNSLELLSFNGNQANVTVAEGNIQCSDSVVIEGDTVASNGNIELNNTCRAGGNLWASGTVSLECNTAIGGDVIAAGTGTGTTRIDPSTRINGGVYTRGPIDSGRQRCAPPRTGWNADGNACSIERNTGASPVFSHRLDVAPPPRPPWVHVNHVASDWQSRGWTTRTDTGPCTIDNRRRADSQVTAFSAYATPTVIDMRDCSTVVFSTSANLNITMRTDLTFIMLRNVNLENFTVASSASIDRALRFTTPDTGADGVPTTTGCGRFDINNRNELEVPVAPPGSPGSLLEYTDVRVP